MGKASIVSNIGEGQYSVQVVYERSQLDERIASIESQISSADAEISQFSNDLVTLEAELQTLQDALSALFGSGTASVSDAYSQKMKVISKSWDVSKKRLQIFVSTAKRLSLQKRLARYQSFLLNSSVINAWCADYSRNLSGDVGTIEPYGEYDSSRTVIRPGYSDNAAWDGGRDGQLQYFGGVGAATAFYNLAMRPGWQRWLPIYRVGTITAIDTIANTCSVAIESHTATSKNLDVSGDAIIHDVPVTYMDCNAQAFADGDRVVVEYIRTVQPSSQSLPVSLPRVIGFESAPKSCGELYFISFEATSTYTPTFSTVRKLHFYTESGKEAKTVDLNAVLGDIPHDNLYHLGMAVIGGGANQNAIVIHPYIQYWRGYTDFAGNYPVMVPIDVFDVETVRKDLVGMFITGDAPRDCHLSPGGTLMNETLVYTGSSHWDMAIGYLLGQNVSGFVTQSVDGYPSDWKNCFVTSNCPCVCGEYLYLTYSYQGYAELYPSISGLFRVHRDNVYGLMRLWYADKTLPSLYSKMEFVYNYGAETGVPYKLLPFGGYLWWFFDGEWRGASYALKFDLSGVLVGRQTVHAWYFFQSITIVTLKGESLFAIQMNDDGGDFGSVPYSPMYLMRPGTTQDAFEIVEAYAQDGRSMVCVNKPKTNHMLKRINSLRVSLPAEARDMIYHAPYSQPYGAVGFNQELSDIAKDHLTWCASNCRLSHEDANGNTVVFRTAPHGYWVAGEVLAYVQAQTDSSAEVDAVVDGWISSPNHYLVLTQFEHIQMGYSVVTLPATCTTLTLGPGMYVNGTYTTTDTTITIPADQRGKIRLYAAIFSGG